MVENSRKDGARSVSKMKPTEIGLIPEDWEVKELKDIASIVGGGTPKTNIISYWKDDINWFTPTELGNCKFISESIRKISYEGLRNSSAKLLPKGTILLTTRASIGDTAILLNEATTNQGFQSLIVNNNTSNEYIYYLIETLKPQLLQNASGSTFLEISPNKVKSLQIPLPPLAEQEAIASALSDADAWIENLEQLIAKKRLIKQGAMQTLLTPQEDWEVKKLGEVCDYKNGKSLENKISDTGEYNIISLNSIDISGKLKKEHHKTNFNDNSLKKGDIVMVLSDVAHGNFLGLCDIIPDDNYVLNQRMGGLFNFRNIHVPFVRLQINYNQKYFKFSGKGSSQLNLGKPDILNFDIKFPSLSEQERIATILSDMDAELEALEAQLAKARQIKQGMMQELLTGRIRLV